ncbi:unnamed protein product [Rotaria sp. Silwood2]|nr:unnamed protein product [Rotaria sp. Silwood2]CAF3292957.1 unnamed protein product [Rotaria sp. Silwood2]CAF3387175.1 unnamed protein product [Rotaria sp. Silwood2]CAF4202865.1 unnamed protein product [Rotaria sp. Silwood2]CAF4299566.1 unnamed protein product [Rotaria sp. Silwood2]
MVPVSLYVYCGQGMSNSELQTIQNSINGRIATNTFLSTTFDKHVAMIYAGNGAQRPKKLSPTDENILDLALTYAHIGAVWSALGGGDNVLINYEKQYQLEQQILPLNRPSMCITLNNIGVLCSKHDKYKDTLNYYRKNIEIKQKSLPNTHISPAACYQNMGHLFFKQKNFAEAINNYQKALEIQQSILSSHSQLFIAYSKDQMRDYNKSIEIYQQALSMSIDNKIKDYLQISSVCNNMRLIDHRQGNVVDCLEHHKKKITNIFSKHKKNKSISDALIDFI